MPRVVADAPLLDDYASRLVDLETLRLRRLQDTADDLDRFFESGSAYGPTSSAAPDAVRRLFSDTAVDGIGVMATAAAFRQADELMAADGFGVWAPTEQWVEMQRREWLMDNYPDVAAAAAAPMTNPAEAAQRIAQIDRFLVQLSANPGPWARAIDDLMAERQALVAEAAVNLNALTDMVNGWRGSDNDPALDNLFRARRDLIEILVDDDAARYLEALLNDGVGALGAMIETGSQQMYEARIAELIANNSVSREGAIQVMAEMDAQIAMLIAGGWSGEDAMTAVAIAIDTDVDIQIVADQAIGTDLPLLEVLALTLTARSMDLTLDELNAFEGFRENFSVFDNATGGDTDDRVSSRDLLYVVGNPGEFTAAQVLAAQAILESPFLRNRLDTAADNGDVLDGDTFGSTEPGDGLIGLRDIDAFLLRTQLNNLVGDYADEIDVAARGGDPDDNFSRRDLQAWLEDPTNADVPIAVREGVQLMLDTNMFDQTWLETHRDDLALGAALLAGGVVIVLSAGTATPLIITLGTGVVAGAGTAGVTTMILNGVSGADLGDGVLGNSIAGGMIGMSVAGLPSAIGAGTTELTVASAMGISGATADVFGIVSLGGTDLLIPEDWEDPVHDVTGTLSDVIGAPSSIYTVSQMAPVPPASMSARPPTNYVRGAVPRGFSSAADFDSFGDELRTGLRAAGYEDVTPIFQGSSVTGRSFESGAAFDGGRLSDFDIALSSPQLLSNADALGVGLRSGGTRTGPLTTPQLRRLGLGDLATTLSETAGRPVNFMVFNSIEGATLRSPSIEVPR